MMRTISLALCLGGCAGATVVSAGPEATKIELAAAEPDRTQCALVGEVQGEAKAKDVGDANRWASPDPETSRWRGFCRLHVCYEH